MLPQPPFKPIYYTLVIIDLCKVRAFVIEKKIVSFLFRFDQKSYMGKYMTMRYI